MAAPTPEELVQPMEARGVTITSADASGILCLVTAITECLELNYPGDTCRQDAIMLWASILIAANTAGRYVTSQHAPSGASQSFAYGSKPWYALYNQMKLLDSVMKETQRMKPMQIGEFLPTQSDVLPDRRGEDAHNKLTSYILQHSWNGLSLKM